MREALFYKKLNGKVNCELCPRNCVINNGNVGSCGVRKNIKGILYSLVYNKPCSVHVDPIEKKPLYHFFPGESALSIGTFGCNLFCQCCQNFQISRESPEGITASFLNEQTPSDIINECKRTGCKIISYTYNEPTVFYEYMLDIAKLAKKEGIKNVIVSNGYIDEKPLKELCKYIDGTNIDLKGDDDYYKKYCRGKLAPVLNSLKILHENKIHLEITTLLIPGVNDDMKKIEKLAKWIKENLGKNIVWHFSRFFPMYKMQNKPATPSEILKQAKNVAEKYVDYVYIGNTGGESNTYCPNCKKLLIERTAFYKVLPKNIKQGKCSNCGNEIYGVFE